MDMFNECAHLPYYHYCVHPVIVDALLRRNGEFLMRRSVDNDDEYFISVRWDAEVKNYLIRYEEGYAVGAGEFFPTLRNMVDHYVTTGEQLTIISGGRLVVPKAFQTWEILGKGIESGMTAEPRLGTGSFSIIRAIGYRRANNSYFEVAAAKMVYHWEEHDTKQKENARSMLYREARVLLDVVGHPNLVSIKGLFVNTEFPALVMDIVKGEDLLKVIHGDQRIQCMRGKLLGALDAASAVAYLHEKGYIHRNIEPTKFMVRYPVCGDRGRLVLVSLRSAKYINGMDIYRGHLLTAMSLRYMAPETMLKRIWMKGSDVWMLAVLMWEMFCGSVPFGEHGVVTQKKLLALLKSRCRLPIPEVVPSNVAEMMRSCWNLNILQRPDASTVISVLTAAADVAVCTH